MVLPSEAAKTLIEKFPGLKENKFWEYYIETKYEKGQESLKLFGLMRVLTNYVSDLLAKELNEEKESELREIFALIEYFLRKGNGSVGDAAATGFLENLINRVAWGDFSVITFLPYLGEKSIEYCKAWDKFTGVQTPGLWKSKWEWWNYKID